MGLAWQWGGGFSPSLKVETLKQHFLERSRITSHCAKGKCKGQILIGWSETRHILLSSLPGKIELLAPIYWWNICSKSGLMWESQSRETEHGRECQREFLKVEKVDEKHCSMAQSALLSNVKAWFWEFLKMASHKLDLLGGQHSTEEALVLPTQLSQVRFSALLSEWTANK